MNSLLVKISWIKNKKLTSFYISLTFWACASLLIIDIALFNNSYCSVRCSVIAFNLFLLLNRLMEVSLLIFLNFVGLLVCMEVGPLIWIRHCVYAHLDEWIDFCAHNSFVWVIETASANRITGFRLVFSITLVLFIFKVFVVLFVHDDEISYVDTLSIVRSRINLVLSESRLWHISS